MKREWIVPYVLQMDVNAHRIIKIDATTVLMKAFALPMAHG